MEELNKDYSGLSRDEQLVLANQWLVKARALTVEKFQYEEAAKYVRKAICVTEKLEVWKPYLNARYFLVILWVRSRKDCILNNVEEYAAKTLEIFYEKRKTHKDELDELGTHFLEGFSEFYYKTGNLTKSLKCALEGLEIAEKLYDTNHEEVIFTCKKVSSCYMYLGDYPKSIAYGENALKKCKFNNNGHVFIDIALNLCDIYGLYGNIEKTHVLVQRILDTVSELEEKKSVPNKYFVFIYKKFAVYFKGIGDYRNVVLYLQKSLVCVTKDLGKEHLRTAQVQRDLGVAFLECNQYEEAIYHLKTALRNQEKVLKLRIMILQNPIN